MKLGFLKKESLRGKGYPGDIKSNDIIKEADGGDEDDNIDYNKDHGLIDSLMNNDDNSNKGDNDKSYQKEENKENEGKFKKSKESSNSVGGDDVGVGGSSSVINIGKSGSISDIGSVEWNIEKIKYNDFIRE
ncbi:hypothetical protein Glove_346g169 [Diversispora epigaea]|uniref:Uncharacterized protein n=1 Tax=Diversispora epigaea TaxID=1348612 RepID=A0A397HMK6_9GLOM|nr:hypothetical protein Glove_346g169 [Diversispora epigaea]